MEIQFQKIIAFVGLLSKLEINRVSRGERIKATLGSFYYCMYYVHSMKHDLHIRMDLIQFHASLGRKRFQEKTKDCKLDRNHSFSFFHVIPHHGRG